MLQYNDGLDVGTIPANLVMWNYTLQTSGGTIIAILSTPPSMHGSQWGEQKREAACQNLLRVATHPTWNCSVIAYCPLFNKISDIIVILMNLQNSHWTTLVPMVPEAQVTESSLNLY